MGGADSGEVGGGVPGGGERNGKGKTIDMRDDGEQGWEGTGGGRGGGGEKEENICKIIDKKKRKIEMGDGGTYMSSYVRYYSDLARGGGGPQKLGGGGEGYFVYYDFFFFCWANVVTINFGIMTDAYHNIKRTVSCI